MPKFIIRETNREIWKYVYSIEAETKEDAEKLYLDGNAEEAGYEYYDTVDTEYNIEEESNGMDNPK
jgi:hypothetical protein